MAGRLQKAREGKWNGGYAPYGYKLEDGKLFLSKIYLKKEARGKGYSSILFRFLEQQARIRTIEHDMKNRLLGIRHYFVSGDVDGGVKKIDDILEAYKAAHQNSEGGKYPWEAVIRSKLHMRKIGNCC